MPINFELAFDEDAVDEILAKPIFPRRHQSVALLVGGVGDKTWALIRDARVTKIEGGYRLLSGNLAKRDGSRARGEGSQHILLFAGGFP